MKPLKAYMRRQWVQHLRSKIEQAKDSNEPFKLRAPSRFELVEWVNDAWDSIPRATIVNGFLKCKIIQALPAQVNVPPTSTGSNNLDTDGSHDDVCADALVESSIVLDTLLQHEVSNFDFQPIHEDDDAIEPRCG
ncbi:Aste57867_4491 [Aphanomyces stellatus]|uniref:Aste57867_4491 protein n=1 Tax=Aphanomyces stellatus TaxID=120398 RepID=A0A485KGT6_9STRA|nr:hypothetical protein As57867_004478 [Aphanomyces stellatus]VFT81601.1 Aste57867_4491 [Aphanomyces stellatus]